MEDQETKRTICPLKPPAQYNPETGETVYFLCEKEVCEWWDKKHECCIINSIAGILMQIEEDLQP